MIVRILLQILKSKHYSFQAQLADLLDRMSRRPSVAATMQSHVTNKAGNIAKCPFKNIEHQRIKDNHRALASTGCTRDICQAGRAIHTDEPRVGENRSVESVCQDADDFLRDLYDEGFLPSERALEARLQAVHAEIHYGASEGVTREDNAETRLGGNWTQTYEELEFGIRRAWRNARKCIARNHAEELKLCDLRSVTSSEDMARELLRNAVEAFSEGRIEPTAFVFPPRVIGSRGPMIWNNQILDFAGYEMEDGTILGDPANVDLTNAIIDLGWTPPQPRGRWNLLPLVTMAEGDKPAMMEIPAPLSKLVDIIHPQFPSVAALNLKWKATPALTRLGFDIGGVQYTAAPFIGWFMDAEIGVRDLADTFRYNVLPDIVQAMGMTEGKYVHGIDSFDDLPEYEQLAMLSRAQSELNYAVQWSFNQAGVTMTDSLTASKKWCKFDDEFSEKHGYRLPADPYWLAPPQGSIIPVWHRGGAPNYQPKPMISKHVQDPIKAWKRERTNWHISSEPTKIMTFSQTAAAFPAFIAKKAPEVTVEETHDFSDDDGAEANSITSGTSTLSELKTIAIYFCSAGTIAEKLAKRLHKRLQVQTRVSLNVALHPRVECLNNLKVTDLTADKIFLFIVSSTGKGEVPPNGSAFLRITRLSSIEGMSFAVFGNGDSRYSSTYNGAAKTIHEHMQILGGHPLIRKVFRGDIAVEAIPYNAMSAWWKNLEPKIGEIINRDDIMIDDYKFKLPAKEDALDEVCTALEYATERLADHARDLRSFADASIVATHPTTSDVPQRSMNLRLDIGSATYNDMNCIQILPLNHPSKVDRALKALSVDGDSIPQLITEAVPTYSTFLTKFADLDAPFKSLNWLLATDDPTTSATNLMREMLSHLSVLETLELLAKTKLLAASISDPSFLQDILLSMPLLHTRTYSVASSLLNQRLEGHNKVDLMLKRISNGRFSSTFINDHFTAPPSSAPALLQYRIVDSISGRRLRKLNAEHEKPLIAVATGAGFGPVKCLLHARIAAARQRTESEGPIEQTMSLFLGFHPTDTPLIQPIVDEATSLGIVDEVYIVESNAEKTRVQDLLIREDIAGMLKENLLHGDGGWIFVCASEGAAKGVRTAFESVLESEGVDESFYIERYLEEVF